jgi:hypothetical protein
MNESDNIEGEQKFLLKGVDDRKNSCRFCSHYLIDQYSLPEDRFNGICLIHKIQFYYFANEKNNCVDWNK